MTLKSAYEIAMERTGGRSEVRLTDEQKKELAGIEAKYKAQIAELEIHFTDQLRAARVAGDPEACVAVEEELTRRRAELNGKKESEKNRVRHAT